MGISADDRNLTAHCVAQVQGAAATIAALTEQADRIAAAAQLMIETLCAGGQVLTAGNGGSAAEAMHMAEELVGRFRTNRRSLPAVSMVSDGTALTCIGNDFGFDEIFARQVWGLGQKGDLLIAFTTSGKSRNVLRALEEANKKKMKSICFLGRDGGFTKGVATLDLIVSGTSTARIQESQKLLFHVLCETVDRELPK